MDSIEMFVYVVISLTYLMIIIYIIFTIRGIIIKFRKCKIDSEKREEDLIELNNIENINNKNKKIEYIDTYDKENDEFNDDLYWDDDLLEQLKDDSLLNQIKNDCLDEPNDNDFNIKLPFYDENIYSLPYDSIIVNLDDNHIYELPPDCV
ncbi:hypothetical protein [Brazilian porcupinepox virus 1]|nr:hypothetical protein [Brazilian porcupinepox virus 1]